MEALLAYVDIPEDCHDAVSLLDLENQSFAKFFRRILKRLEKGETSVQKILPKLSNDGTEGESEYLLIGTTEEEKSSILFARLPNTSGGNEVYRLPFIRFSVRRINNPIRKGSQDIKNNEIEPYLQDTFKRLDDKIENFGVQLSRLVESLSQKPTTPRSKATLQKSQIAITTESSDTPLKPASTQNSMSNLQHLSTPKPTSTLKPTLACTPKGPSTPKPTVKNQANSTNTSAGNQLKSPTKQLSRHVLESPALSEKSQPKAGIKKPTESLTQNTNSQIENPIFASMIDSAIDHVLERINKGKDIPIGPILQERLSSTTVNGSVISPYHVHHDHIDIDDDYTDADNNAVLHDKSHQINPIVQPTKKNLVAISPCVSFMVKPVQSSAAVDNSKTTYQNKKKHRLSITEHEALEAVAQDNPSMNSIHYSYAEDDYNDGAMRKQKHKKRRHTED
ncbi:hypothetical protein EWB00_007433 [Schistosoma japonicum]|uniref:Uncharacterized protein n=1 Tax=Schistosoma japonicum TaxID=6182 RepID=A0A4Z2CUS6_SCHJA|nr:hypothetical protein EWB00_007433 [Schistosoma japonicum]TNN07914.1 hypothetical protein EWB00_007433 [Schistosoma japonicum]